MPSTDSVIEQAKKIQSGFRVDLISVLNPNNSDVIWQSTEDISDESKEHLMVIPIAINQLSSVSVEMDFRSNEVIENFHMFQRIYYKRKLCQSWDSQFGYVQRHSLNSWQTWLIMTPPSEVMPLQILSGETTIETFFMEQRSIIARSVMRIYYA